MQPFERVTNAFSGHDGLKLWAMPEVHRISNPPKLRVATGAITACIWITRTDSDCQPEAETLCFGTSTGTLGIWQQDENVLNFILHSLAYLISF